MITRSRRSSIPPIIHLQPATLTFGCRRRDGTKTEWMGCMSGAIGGVLRRAWLPFAFVIAWAALFTTWILLPPGGSEVTRTFDDLAQGGTAFAAAGCCAWAAWGLAGRRRAAWILFAAGLVAWGFGQVVWSIYELVLHQDVPPVSVADAGFLSAAVLSAIGLGLLPAPRGRPALVGRAIIDGAAVGGILLWISWALVGQRVLDGASGGDFATAVNLAYPLGDVLILSMAAYAAAFSSRDVRLIIVTIAAGWAFAALADSAYAYEQALGIYVTGNLADAGWVTGFALVGLAGVLAARRDWPPPRSDARPRLPALIVYATIAGGIAVYAARGPAQAITGVLFWDAIVIAMLLVVRQFLGAADNRALYRQREQALQAQHESEAQLEQLVAQARVVLFAVDADGTITAASGSAVPNIHDGIGFNLKQVPDHPLNTVVGPALQGSVGHGTIEVRGRLLEIRCTPVFRNDLVERVVGVGIDVTDRHAAETARRESEAKDRFLANMSHELRTPLNSILGFAQMLEFRTTGPLNERQRRYQQNIVSSGSHLLELINELLDVAKVSSGKLELETSPIEVEPIVAEAIAMMRPQAEAAALSIEVEPLGRLIAMADPRRLRQVVLNLLANAVKFTPTGGWIRIGGSVEGNRVRLDVSDSGIGIPAADQERIFEEFTQLNARRDRGVQGTGLGLALARALARRMGGDLVVRSSEGQGSTFSVLMVAGPDPAAKPVARGVETPLSPTSPELIPAGPQ
jgi:signal transduction histidine kinase